MTIRSRKRLVFIAALGLLFCFRLAFGLCSDFRPDVGDERQVYLIGLKYYATGQWPYFGPDVTNTIQIPGALQGLLVGLPFYTLHIPEAPYILLNILSFSSLCFFAWYCTKRLPDIPQWFVWSWLLTAPWALNISTQVYNPSYVLTGSVLFFIGGLETYPSLTRNLVPLWLANLMMGAALFWIMQLHLSWVVLIPYVLVSLYFQFKVSRGNFASAVAWFICGSIITGSFLLPTFLHYGLTAGLGGTNEVAQVNPYALLRQLNIIEGVLGRFLSFASFELPRFIGNNTATRLAFVRTHLWLGPFVIFLTAVGILQAIALFALWFKKNHPQKDWKAVKFLTLGTIVLLYASFLFSVKAPLSHTFYVTFPLSMLYGFYCWEPYLVKPFWRRFAAVVIICGIVFHLGLAVHNYSRVSLYLERAKISEAIEKKEYQLVGERRPGARY